MNRTTTPSTERGSKFGSVPFEPYAHLLDLTDQEAERQLAVAMSATAKILVNGQEKEEG